jgi:hypothetical protein
MSFPVTINGTTYTEAMFLDYGWRTAIPNITADIATVAGNAVTAGSTATTSASTATTQAGIATTKAAEALASAATAVAAATSTDYPFTTTAGSSTAYTVDFTPDRTVADGFSARINFHTTSGANPTLTVDGASTKGLVDGSRFDGTGAYINISAGRIPAGFNGIVMYDSGIDKYVVFNLPLKGAVAGISRASTSLSADQTFALSDEGIEQYLTGTTQRTWTVPTEASVNFPLDSEIPVFNRATGVNLLITFSATVVVYSGGVEYTAKTLTLLPGESGRLKKLGTNYWIWVGDNRDGWV